MKVIHYGEQTKKALDNFPFSTSRVGIELIYAIAEIKKAVAIAHCNVGEMKAEVKDGIVKACDEIISGKFDDQFNLASLQGGAGTSIHANVNEVIASLAGVHANDDVNQSQSTNDVVPSALKIASIRLTKELILVVDQTAVEFEKKAKEFSGILKLGRTHLQDAVPTTLASEFASYAAIFRRHSDKIQNVLPYLHELNLGGTAVGNRINASDKYVSEAYVELKKVTKLPLKPALNFMPQTSSQGDFVTLSQAVTAMALDASKIASDLRLLTSGPNGGLNEIILPEMQKGSSIMPGKVNPVLPEMVNQLYFLVSGNNLRIEHSAHAAQLELGVMGPSIADALIASLKISKEVLMKFSAQCVRGIKANEKMCRRNLEASTAFATLFTPSMGYDKVAELVKESAKDGKSFRDVVIEKKLLTAKEFEAIIKSFEL